MDRILLIEDDGCKITLVDLMLPHGSDFEVIKGFLPALALRK